MNLFMHYGYYEENFERNIADSLLSEKVVDSIVIPRGDKWEGIRVEGRIKYIPSTPDFVESYDINELMPVSREFIERFTRHELIALNMLIRETYCSVFEYEEAREKLAKYVRFWHHFFVTEKIDFFFTRYIGQYLFEYVMYAVAESLDIPVSVCYGKKWGNKIENIGAAIQKTYIELVNSDETDFELDNEDKELYARHRNGGETKCVINSVTKKKDVQDCVRQAKAMFSIKNVVHSYLSCIKYLVEGKKHHNIRYISYAKEKIKYYNTLWFRTYASYLLCKKSNYYNRIAQNPQYIKPYIYCALQTVPEIALTPMAGNYDNQMYELHMLSYCAEKYGIEIYVKEHIYQHWRKKSFYDQIRKLRNVVLIKTTVDTYELIENAVATATFTGSCSMEGIMRGVPALIFANNEWRGLPGSFYITNVDDCCKSIEAILNHEYEITDRNIKAYLCAREITSLNTDQCIGNDYSGETKDEYNQSVGEHVAFIRNRICDYDKEGLTDGNS